MVVKVFISGISASKEVSLNFFCCLNFVNKVSKFFFSFFKQNKKVKKHQIRAQFLLDSYKIKYELIDISDPLMEKQKEIMLQMAKRRNESTPPQPPQFFNEDQYCGVGVFLLLFDKKN